MMVQWEKFVGKGIIVEFVGEAQEDKVVFKVLEGKLQLFLISPENLLSNPKYRSMLLTSTYKNKLVALAIDEAHCVKTW